MLVYSIYDIKAKSFGMPFFQQNEEIAIRSFRDLTNDPESMTYRHPDDFTLFQLAEFDADTGIIVGLDQPKTIVNALEIQTPKAAA